MQYRWDVVRGVHCYEDGARARVVELDLTGTGRNRQVVLRAEHLQRYPIQAHVDTQDHPEMLALLEACKAGDRQLAYVVVTTRQARKKIPRDRPWSELDKPDKFRDLLWIGPADTLPPPIPQGTVVVPNPKDAVEHAQVVTALQNGGTPPAAPAAAAPPPPPPPAPPAPLTPEPVTPERPARPDQPMQRGRDLGPTQWEQPLPASPAPAPGGGGHGAAELRARQERYAAENPPPEGDGPPEEGGGAAPDEPVEPARRLPPSTTSGLSTRPRPARPDPKPWEPLDSDITRNLGSYQAANVFKAVALASRLLTRRGRDDAQGFIEPTASEVADLAAKLLYVTDLTMRKVTDRRPERNSQSYRLFADAVREAVDLYEPPYDEDRDTWLLWCQQAVERASLLMGVTMALFEGPPE